MSNFFNPTHFLIVEGLMILSGVIGYYCGHRGFAGVASDLNDIKLDVKSLKATPTTVVPTVVTPVAV